MLCKRLVLNFCATRTTINPTMKKKEKAQELFIRSLSTFSPHKKNHLTDYQVQQEIYLVLQFKTKDLATCAVVSSVFASFTIVNILEVVFP